MNIQFHITKSDNSSFNKYIFEQLKSGDEVRLEGPDGDFILDDDAPNPITLIAMDTGFAPVKSLAEHALTLAHTEQVYLYWLTSNKHQHYLRNLCRAWDDAFDSLQYSELNIKHGLETVAGKKEFTAILSSVIDKQADIDNSHIYLAGNSLFITESKKLFAASPAPRLLFEQTD